MEWEWVFAQFDEAVLHRAELRAAGATARGLTAAVRAGFLIRARRDCYLLPNAPRAVVEAVRVGGRVTCTSRLELAGIFTMGGRATHIHMTDTMSRMRTPSSRGRRLTRHNREGVELHWWALSDETTRAAVSIRDALLHALRCQEPWLALASIENALFLRIIDEADVREIFAAAPQRVADLEELVDGRAEAGQETVLRMLALSIGLKCEPQVYIPGVGRVDLLVGGCLVVEADSRLAHDGWEHHIEDRRRDLALANLGYMSLRPAFQHTMHEPALVRGAIESLLAEHPRFGR